MSAQNVNVLPPLRRPPAGPLWLTNVVEMLAPTPQESASGHPSWFEALRVRWALERAERRDARARADLFALARRYESTQPEFAKDLVAAACNDCRA